jgi:hypothetical protein
MKKLIFIAVSLSLFIGCAERRQGPMERAGARVDEIADNIEEGKPALHRKGPLEKAGEAVDDALDGDRR